MHLHQSQSVQGPCQGLHMPGEGSSPTALSPESQDGPGVQSTCQCPRLLPLIAEHQVRAPTWHPQPQQPYSTGF